MTHGRSGEMPTAPDTPRFRSDLGAYLRARTRPRTRRFPWAGRRWLVLPGVALVAAVALVLAGPLTGDRPQGVTLAGETLVLDDGTRIPVGDPFDPADYDRLRKAFEDAGATLVIHEVPVAAAAEGRVLEGAFYGADRPTGFDQEITVAPGDRVEFTVWRPARDSERVTTEGLSVFEVFPEVEKAVQVDDPVATGESIEKLGFAVEWWLDGRATQRDAPPPGTYVMTVLGPNGRATGVDPDADTLAVDLTHDRELAERLHAGRGSGG